MSSYASDTNAPPGDVLKRVIEYFGPQGLGLRVRESNEGGADLVGGDGDFVHAEVVTRNRKTHIDLDTQDWDHFVKKFLMGV